MSQSCPHDSYPVYKAIIGPVRERARQLGYAIGVHGTLKRDIDLIACPWTSEAVSAAELAGELAKVIAEHGPCGLAFINPREEQPYAWAGQPGYKPHGRLVWAFHVGTGPYVDLSVMPRAERPTGEEIVRISAATTLSPSVILEGRQLGAKLGPSEVGDGITGEVGRNDTGDAWPEW